MTSAPCRPAATFGVDVDPIDFHLAASGHASAGPDPVVYTHALPRLAAIFERAGVRATFFVLGRDAAAFSRPLAALAAAGHEIASHSFSAPFAFARLSHVQMCNELIASRNALETSLRITVTGFRAPQFDLDSRGVAALIACGYRYDASADPTPWLAVRRAAMTLRSVDVASTSRLRAWPFTLRREPHVRRSEHGALVEFPASVTPWRRLPIRHTARPSWSKAEFDSLLDRLARRGDPLSYPLHALDALGLEEDRLDGRLAQQVGMNVPLDQRLARIEETVRAIAARFQVATFKERSLAFANEVARENIESAPAIAGEFEARRAA